MSIPTLLAAILAATPSLAQPASPAPVQAQAPTRLSYAVYSHGFRVAELEASLALSPTEYAVQVTYRLTGLVGLFASGDSTTAVDGRFNGTSPVPRELLSTSHSRGRTRVTQLDWQNGNPVTTQLVPPLGGEREPVPPAQQARTIDTLSALAGLLRQVAATGKCDATRTTFDGRRLSVLTARTVGDETLEATSRSIFGGPALRCDFQGRQTGGFSFDSDPATRGDPQPGTAWFARLQPGGALLPVRITFESPSIGAATVYVTAVQ